MDTGTTRRTPVFERSPFFFTSSMRRRHDFDKVDMPTVKKKKSQILTDGQIITIDFVMYPKTKKLTSLRSHYRES